MPFFIIDVMFSFLFHCTPIDFCLTFEKKNILFKCANITTKYTMYLFYLNEIFTVYVPILQIYLNIYRFSYADSCNKV